MRIKPSTRVHSMLRIHPQLEDLEDHDIDVDAVSQMSIRQACSEFDLDLDEVVDDLRSSLRDSATEGWLDVGEDSDDADSDDDYEEEEEDYYEDDDAGSGGGLLDDDDEEEADWD